jgi:predicted dehydrogenase
VRNLRLAVIGAGLIGKRHIDLIAADPACELAAICDAQPAAAALAAPHGTRFFADYTTMLAEVVLDGVIIATPNHLHVPVGLACLARGLPILVEKPIAENVAAAQRLVDIADTHGVPVLVGHHRRHNPLVQQTRAWLQQGQLGRLIGVSALFALLKPDDYYNVTWRTKPGGGPVLINLIHDIDNLRYICGEIASVYGVTSNQGRGFAVEDSAAITLQFTNGALGTIFVSDTTVAPWSYELTSQENPAYPPTGQDCYQFYGTQGALAFPSLRHWHYADPQQAGWYAPLTCDQLAVTPQEPLAAQLRHFCQVIRREAAPLVSGLEGLKTLAATLAVLESAQRQAPVQLNHYSTVPMGRSDQRNL